MSKTIRKHEPMRSCSSIEKCTTTLGWLHWKCIMCKKPSLHANCPSGVTLKFWITVIAQIYLISFKSPEQFLQSKSPLVKHVLRIWSLLCKDSFWSSDPKLWGQILPQDSTNINNISYSSGSLKVGNTEVEWQQIWMWKLYE